MRLILALIILLTAFDAQALARGGKQDDRQINPYCGAAYKPDTYREESPIDMSGYTVEETNDIKPLDMSGLYVTFEDEFNYDSITSIRGGGKWKSYVHGGIEGSTPVIKGHPYDPLSVHDGMLTITLKHDGTKWYSAFVRTIDDVGCGFSQKYGYFESKIRYATDTPAIGSWGGFWLKTTNQYYDYGGYTGTPITRVEFDVIEYYPPDWDGFHGTIHLWPNGGNRVDHWYKGCYRAAATAAMADGDWHTYGVYIKPDYMTIYFDRREVCKFPTPPEAKHTFYLLLDHTFNTNTNPANSTFTPIPMDVDYVRVWQHPDLANK